MRGRRAHIAVLGVATVLALGLSAADAQAGLRLLSPRAGSVLTRPPLLRWTPVDGATHYNVQLWRGNRKVLSRWPVRPRLQLHRFWTFRGRRESLRPARYRWFVWPGYRWGYGHYRQRSFIIGRRPVNTGLPVIAGESREGVSLTASTGRWSGTRPLRFYYEWRRCSADGSACAAIPGARSRTLLLGADEIDLTVRVVVIARNLAGSRAVASAQTPVILAAPPANVSAPNIVGAFQQGRLVTAKIGSWQSSRPVTYSFRWQRCAGEVCRTIRGVTAAGYLLRTADFGRRVRVVVRAVNSGGATEATSAASRVIGRVFLGTPFRDVLRGSIGADVMRGRGGNDRLAGGFGRDRLAGGWGADSLLGGPGNDVVVARDRQADRVNCGLGEDVAVINRGDRVAGCESVLVR